MLQLRQVRLAEAYEVLLEECKLEAFAHRYPTAAEIAEEGESIADEEVNSDSETESAHSSSSTEDERSQTTSRRSGTAELDEQDSEHTADDWLVGWTETELAIFFPSLARRSRLFPDLIAQDLDYSKSPSQVAHLLSLLRRQSNLEGEEQIEKARQQQGNIAPFKIVRKSRRIARLWGAHEVSDEWLEFEEKMSSRLQEWQEAEDAEEGSEGIANKPVQQRSSQLEADEVEREVQDGSSISWDKQVMNALLFLRHHPEVNPDFNPANFIYNVPLSYWSGEPEVELFSFSSSVAIQLLISSNRNGTSQDPKYKNFCRFHPCPNTHFSDKTKRETLAWRILFRGVELGILAWVKNSSKSRTTLPEGTLSSRIDRSLRSTQKDGSTFRQAEGASLVWLDGLIGDERSQVAKNRLEEVRHSATQRLLNTLPWEEAQTISSHYRRNKLQQSNGGTTRARSLSPEIQPAMPSLARSVQEKSENGGFFMNIDLSSYPYTERNKIRSRIQRRILRLGEEAALAMPIEAQQGGRKRKGEEQEEYNARKKKRGRLEDSQMGQKQVNEDEDEGGDEDEDEDSEPDNESQAEDEGMIDEHEEHFSASLQLPRFERIGVSLDSVLPQNVKDLLKLFRLSKLKKVTIHAFTQSFDEDFAQLDGLSLAALKLLGSLLHDFVSELMLSALDIASSVLNGKHENPKSISSSHVKAALRESSRLYSNLDTSERSNHFTGLDSFRSDPPRQYFCDAIKQQELQIQLHGLKSLGSESRLQQQQQHCSIVKDSVISASDAFSIPTSTAYAPQQNADYLQDGNLGVDEDYFDSEESSVFDDSEQEREVEMRRDEIRGARREKERINSRAWDYNERREEEECKRWQQLDILDKIRAAKHEKKLWTSMGLEPREASNLFPEDGIDQSGAEEEDDGESVSDLFDDGNNGQNSDQEESQASDQESLNDNIE